MSLRTFPALCCFVLIRAQNTDLAQPATASIKGQCTLNQLQVCAACIPRKAHLEVPIGTESITLSTFILGLLNLKEHKS